MSLSFGADFLQRRLRRAFRLGELTNRSLGCYHAGVLAAGTSRNSTVSVFRCDAEVFGVFRVIGSLKSGPLVVLRRLPKLLAGLVHAFHKDGLHAEVDTRRNIGAAFQRRSHHSIALAVDQLVEVEVAHSNNVLAGRGSRVY